MKRFGVEVEGNTRKQVMDEVIILEQIYPVHDFRHRARDFDYLRGLPLVLRVVRYLWHIDPGTSGSAHETRTLIPRFRKGRITA